MKKIFAKDMQRGQYYLVYGKQAKYIKKQDLFARHHLQVKKNNNHGKCLKIFKYKGRGHNQDVLYTVMTYMYEYISNIWNEPPPSFSHAVKNIIYLKECNGVENLKYPTDSIFELTPEEVLLHGGML